MNKKVLESLIKSGACDSLEGNRAQLYNLIEPALKFGQRYHDDHYSNQSNLFTADTSSTYSYPALPNIDNWDEKENFYK